MLQLYLSLILTGAEQLIGRNTNYYIGTDILRSHSQASSGVNVHQQQGLCLLLSSGNKDSRERRKPLDTMPEAPGIPAVRVYRS